MLLPYVCVGGCSAPAMGGPALVTDEAQAVSQTTGRDWVGLSERLAASYSALPQGSSHRIDLAIRCEQVAHTGLLAFSSTAGLLGQQLAASKQTQTWLVDAC